MSLMITDSPGVFKGRTRFRITGGVGKGKCIDMMFAPIMGTYKEIKQKMSINVKVLLDAHKEAFDKE